MGSEGLYATTQVLTAVGRFLHVTHPGELSGLAGGKEGMCSAPAANRRAGSGATAKRRREAEAAPPRSGAAATRPRRVAEPLRSGIAAKRRRRKAGPAKRPRREAAAAAKRPRREAAPSRSGAAAVKRRRRRHRDAGHGFTLCLFCDRFVSFAHTHSAHHTSHSDILADAVLY